MTKIQRYATPREASTHYGISTRTLARLRANGTGPEWTRIGRSVRYPIQTIPGVITVLSEMPLGELGDVLPDPHAPWRTIVDAQELEPADPDAETAWLTTLRVASTSERDRALAGYRALLTALRTDGTDNATAGVA